MRDLSCQLYPSYTFIYPDFGLCDHCPIAVTCGGCKRDNKVPHWLLKTSLQLFSNIVQLFKSQSKSWILHRICILLGFKTQQHLSPWLTSTKSTPNRTYTSSYTKNENQERHAWSNHPKCITPGVRVLVPPVARNLMCRAPMPSSYSAQTDRKKETCFWWRWGWVPGMTSFHGWIQSPATSSTFSDCH